jgi:hypothetical protein
MKYSARPRDAAGTLTLSFWLTTQKLGSANYVCNLDPGLHDLGTEEILAERV